jgi:serine/threonine-protein kinase
MRTLAAQSYTYEDDESTLLDDEVRDGRARASAPAARLEGRCLDGRYRLAELIGEGGFGRVYRAEQLDTGDSVAIKVIGPVGSADRDVARQFDAEVAAASRVHHGNVAAIFDHGRTEDGLLYLVMEHVSGRTLASLLDQDGALPLDRALDVTVQILHAVAAAHAAGVVHADLKSANILIRDRHRNEQVKLIDFSIARLLHDSEHNTAVWGRGHRIAGTPAYMAPEVVAGHAPTQAADLYAVGVLLHRMVTGALPFVGENSLDIMMQHLDEPVVRPGERFAHLGLPAALDDIIVRALAKDPAARFADAAELIRALEAVLMCLRPVAARRCRTAVSALRLPAVARVIQCPAHEPHQRALPLARSRAPVHRLRMPDHVPGDVDGVHGGVHACRAGNPGADRGAGSPGADRGAGNPGADRAVSGTASAGPLAPAPERRALALLDPRRRARPAPRQLSDLSLQ